MKISFFGAGLMGTPMVEQLMEAGHNVTVYNRTLSKAQALQDKGAEVAQIPQEAVGQAECIIFMLSDGQAIEEIISRIDLTSLSGKTIIQISTIAPEQSVNLQTRIEEAKGSYLECPVLGSIKEVKESSLILMVGASSEKFEEWKEFLKVFGPNPILVGKVGSAAALKLALNQLIASLTSCFSISLGLVQKYDIDVDIFMKILSESALYAPTFTKKLPRMLERDFDNPNFPTKHLLKDIDLFIQSAESHGLNTKAIHGVREIILDTLKQRLDEKDYSSLYNAINPS